jgi:prevent-host-death family protein
MIEVGMHEAKTRLSQLVERALAGEDVVISRNGAPAVRLSPIDATATLATVRGAWRGQVVIADDFDELPADIAESFGA